MNALNNIYIVRRSFPFIGLQIVLLVVQLIGLQNVGMESFSNACLKVFLFTAVDIALQVAALVAVGRLISIGGLFLIATYLVNLSYIALVAFHAQGATSALVLIYLSRYGQRTLLLASVYALNATCFMFLGYLFLSMFRMRSQAVPRKNTKGISSNLYWRLGVFASVLFGTIYFASTAYQIAFALSQGSYVDLASVNQSTLVSVALNLQPFFFAGLYLLMVHYKIEGRLEISRKILLFAVLCLALSFLTGSRSRGMMLLLVLLVLWTKTVEGISPKTFFLYALCGIILLQALYAIRSVRAYDLSLLNYVQAFFSMENSLLYETLNEFGASICATAGLMNSVSEAHLFDFFVKELGSVLPGISSWGGDAFLSPTVREGIEQQYHMGSTYVGDLYFYFGFAGQYLAAFYGAWVGLLDGFVESKNHRGAFWAVAVAFPGIYTVFNSVRAPISLGLKMFLYSFVIFELLTILVRRRGAEQRAVCAKDSYREGTYGSYGR